MSKLTLDEAIKRCEEAAELQEANSLIDRWDDDYEYSESVKENCRQCAADYRQLAEWLTELKEAKRLLKSAANVLNMFIPCDEDYNCSECIKQRQNCEYDDSFKWRYLDEALKLIGDE